LALKVSLDTMVMMGLMVNLVLKVNLAHVV
jgi:hypothetical protein